MTAVAEQQRHVYRPIGSALELFKCRDDEVLLSGPAGTGKSRACLEKLHAMALANPGMRGLIVRKTATSLASTALVTFREHVAAEALTSGELNWYSGSPQEAASYQYGNGSVIVVGGMDKSSRIMSSEYDAIYVQEATELTEDDWEMITTRLRNGVVSFQQLMADANPSAPSHWLKRRCDAGRCTMIYCSHQDNPRLYADGGWTAEGAIYRDRLNALSGVRKLRLADGKWAAADGLIYDTFDPAIHIYDHIGWPPESWTRYWSVDFGYTNPFVCQFWAMDPDGRLYLYREIYQTQRLVEDHCDAILAAMKGKRQDVMPRAVIADHDAEGRATLERKLGISTIPAHKSVLEGIEAVKARLKVAGDGKPRLYICRDALVERDTDLAEASKPACTQEEITEYVWTTVTSHDTLRAQRETPRKENDHGMDAMRYVVANIDLVGRPRMRWL